MADQQKQSGATATNGASDFSSNTFSFNVRGSIEGAKQGASVLILNERGDPVDTAWTDPNGNFTTKLQKGTYKVKARDLSGNPIGEAKTLSFGKDGFEALDFTSSPHRDDSHVEAHLHLPHPEHTAPLTQNSQEVQQALSSRSTATLDLKTSTQEVNQDSRYKSIVEQLLREQDLSTPINDKALREKADRRFNQQYPQVAQFYDERVKIPKEKSDAAIFEQYEKQSKEAADQAVQNAYETWKKGDRKTAFNKQKIYDDERYRMAAQFIALNTDKSTTFAKQDKYIGNVYRYYDEQAKISAAKPTIPTVESTASNQVVKDGPETVASVESFLSKNPSTGISESQSETPVINPSDTSETAPPTPSQSVTNSEEETELEELEELTIEEQQIINANKMLNITLPEQLNDIKLMQNKANQKIGDLSRDEVFNESKFRAGEISESEFESEKIKLSKEIQDTQKDLSHALELRTAISRQERELISKVMKLGGTPFTQTTINRKTKKKTGTPSSQKNSTPEALTQVPDKTVQPPLDSEISQVHNVQETGSQTPVYFSSSQDTIENNQLQETQALVSNALALEQAVMQEDALSRADMIEQSQARMQAVQQAQLFQNEAIEEDNRRQERKIQRPQRKKGLDKVSNSLQKARRLQKDAQEALRVVRGVVQVVRFIPPPILIVLLVLFFVFIIIFLVLNKFGFFQSSTEQPIRQIQNFGITITGKDTAKVGEVLKYDVKISYVENPQLPYENITVQYKIPNDVTFISASGASDVNEQSRIVSWKLGQVENRAGFSVVIQPTADNIVLQNQVIATSTTGGLPYNPGTGIEDTSSKSLAEAFVQSSQRNNIPVAFLKAIAKKESGVLGFKQEDYNKFNTPNWFVGKIDNAPKRENNDPDIIRGYGYNTCLYSLCYVGADVRGAMQFDLPAWNDVKGEVSPIVGHDGERRYVRDGVLGSGVYIRKKTEKYKDRFGPFNSKDWTEVQVKAMARSYCGGNPDVDVKYDQACGVTRNGKRYGYDEIVWEYYQEFKAIGN